MSDIIVGYELAKDYINNNLPEGFPYKMDVKKMAFLSAYQSYGYYSKRYANKYYQSGELINSTHGDIFF